VTVGNFDPVYILAIIPEISILILALTVLALDLILPDEQRRNLGWVTAAGLFLIIGVSLLTSRPIGEPELIWGGMIRHDWLGFIFKMVFIFAAAVTALFSMDLVQMGRRGEYYLLMLASTIGMNLMASAADLIMLYLAIETTAIPLYILAGFLTKDEKSTESGFKYFLFGAMTSAIMLYGFSLLYGFAGTTSLYGIVQGLASGGLSVTAIVASLFLVLVGFGFKISAVPLHFWAPDVYEGAPTPIAGFLSTASKAAGFAVLARVLVVVFPSISPEWGAIMTSLAIATMTIGNLLALAQKNIKRLLAYSSIAHAGYVLIGIVAISRSGLGLTSALFYLIVYIVTNLTAFGIVAVFGRESGSDDIAAYAGMSRRSPWLALALLVTLLSLAGMPPFGGFIVKFAVFAAAVDAGMVWLAVIGVLNAIVGLYYYLTILKVVYLYRSEEDNKPLSIPRPFALGLTALSVLIILIGSVFAPWFGMANTAAAALIMR